MMTSRAIRLTFVLSCCVLVAPAASLAQIKAGDARVDYLVALGRLWATVKYFHPAIDEGHPEVWDQAALGAIPRVLEARSAEDFIEAARAMVATLGDPVTRIEHAAPEVARSAPWGFARVEHRDGVLLVTSGPVAGDALDTAAPVAAGLKDATAIVFDLRAGPAHPWLFSVQFLATSTVPYPAHRFRLHHGNVTPRGAEDTAYYSGLVTRTAPVPGGSIGTRDVPAVFLVRDSSQLPLAAVALQAAKRGHIIAEGAIDDRYIARHAMATHHQLPLINGYVAHVRTSEMLHADGTTGLVADRVVDGDGLPVALAAAQGRVPHAQRPAAGPAYRVKAAEAQYADEAYPPGPLRVLAAFRFVGVFEWLYPYKALIGRDVVALVRDALPELLSARNALEYHLAVAALVAQVGDSHATASSQTLTEAWGSALPPIDLRPVEGRAVVVGVHDDAGQVGLEVGDVIERVDGHSAAERLAYLSRHISASSKGALERDAVSRLLRGADGSVAQVVVAKADGRSRDVRLVRRPRSSSPWQPTGDGASVKLLDNGIGYIDLGRLMPHEVTDAFAKVAGTKGLIFDMRGYPNDTRHLVAARLMSSSRTVRQGTIGFPIALEPGTVTETRLDIGTFLRGSDAPYRGQTVMLIDERAQSQSEATAVLLKAAAGTVMIGTPTTGALGEGSNFTVPGGIGIGLTGTSVAVDGRYVQRVGVQPDIVAVPTIAGIRARRDEILERAIEFLTKGR
jgi:C-terminal processing protease CtpA/Prc